MMTMTTRAAFVLLAWQATLPVSAQAPAQPKISASAVLISMVDAPDIQIPAEFRFAVYEQLVEQVRASGAFQKVYRAGDHAADGISDLVTLHATVEGFRQGNQTVREMTAVLGATSVQIAVSATARDGHTLVNEKITGRVRFFAENLGVTNDLAKRITKLVRDRFQTGS